MVRNIRIKRTVEKFTDRLFYVLFDDDKEDELKLLQKKFIKIYETLSINCGQEIWTKFCNQLNDIKEQTDLDAIAIEKNDPAAKSLREVYLSYPGFYAIAIHRMSHALHKLNVQLIPRMMSEFAHGKTGIDIHPGASIGHSFYIDHGTGIVIGETAIIKDHVKIFQGVTLGGIQIKKEHFAIKRHPTIEDNVTIYANATILGGDIVIGKNSIIGANVWITESVPENSMVLYRSEIKISQRNSDR